MLAKKSISLIFATLLVVVMLIGGAAFPTSVRAASTITVNSTADNTTHDGSCTLREAITNANADLDTTGGDCVAGSGADTIIFASSLGTITIALTSALPNISDADGLTIDGDNRITLSGNDTVRVLKATSPLTLQNISVTHGNVVANVSDNVGGGVYSKSTLIIINSTFSGNNARTGGGIANDNGTATITHSNFSNNSVTVGGGGLQNAWGTMTITHSTFLNNHSDIEGGGVDNIGTLTISNSTFSNNSAGYGGGGLENNSGTVTILNSTFSGNSAPSGGGVATYNGNPIPPTTTIRNTILANSTAGGDCYNHPTGTLIGGNNIIETTTTCASIATLTSDPNLGSLTGSPAYFPLNTGSPAINAGDDSVCAAAPVSNTSQNSAIRPQGVHCDIGSFELDNTPPTVLSSNRADTNPTSAAIVHFTVTFSELVSGVDTSDFGLTTTGGLAGTAVAAVTGGPTIYTVSVISGSGDGTIRLDLNASGTGIQDQAGNAISGGFVGGETYTVTGTRVFYLYLPLIMR